MASSQVNISQDKIKEVLIPLPPLAEQKRIVAKLEELMPLIDAYEKEEEKLSALEKSLPEKLRRSVLQQAVEGKLVPQIAEEGTAAELLKEIEKERAELVKAGKMKKAKPLPEISEEEIPFEIPESWEWVRLGGIVNIVSARRVHQSDWKTEGVPFYRAREIVKLADFGFVDNELYISQELYDKYSEYGVPKSGDLMVSGVGTLGKTYVVKDGDCFYYKDASVLCFENFGRVNPEYLKRIMESPYLLKLIYDKSAGTTVDTITIEKATSYLIPLPPLAEQKRIVSKVEELMQIIDKL